MKDTLLKLDNWTDRNINMATGDSHALTGLTHKLFFKLDSIKKSNIKYHCDPDQDKEITEEERKSELQIYPLYSPFSFHAQTKPAVNFWFLPTHGQTKLKQICTGIV